MAPVLVLLSYVIGPTPMNLQFWPGAVVMMLIATLTASLVTNSGRSAWFVGVLVLMVYLVFAMTLYLLPPETLSATPCGPTPNKVTFSLSRPAPQDVDKVHEPAALRCCRIEQLFARRRLGEAADLR